MNKKKSTILVVALVVSVCFNLFFVAAYLRTRTTLRQLATPEGRLELAVARLGLSPEQKRKIKTLATEFQTGGGRLQKAYQEQINTFWDEMVKDEPDLQLINSLLKQGAVVARRAQVMKVGYLRRILKELTPNQREQCVKMIREKKLFSK